MPTVNNNILEYNIQIKIMYKMFNVYNVYAYLHGSEQVITCKTTETL